MAKAKAKTNLSQAVREYFTANPNSSAKEVVAGLGAKGITVKEGLVYAVKGSMKEKKRRKKRVAKAAMAATTTPSSNGTVAKADAITMIRAVKDLCSQGGRVREAEGTGRCVGGIVTPDFA